MKRLLPAIALIAAGLAVIILFRRPAGPAVNPDPNHTHADFRVMLDGVPVDFSSERYMSKPAEDGRYPGGPMRQFLHLHDGIGNVIHRHKPGLTLADFFESLSIGFTANCMISRDPDGETLCSESPWRIVVNGKERPFSLSYDFQDTDKILLTTADDQADLEREWAAMTDDACLYSRTCPERGDPPAENCIADPTVPCVIVD